MATKIALFHSKRESLKATGLYGFSFTVFFFGVLALLFRKQWFHGFMYLLFNGVFNAFAYQVVNISPVPVISALCFFVVGFCVHFSVCMYANKWKTTCQTGAGYVVDLEEFEIFNHQLSRNEVEYYGFHFSK